MAPKYTEGARRIARVEGLCLVALEINGRPAKRESATFAGPVGPETLAEVYRLFERLCDVERRMK